MKKPRIAALLAAAVSMTSLLVSSESSAWTGLDGPPFPFWGSVPVKYYVNKATFPSGIAATAESKLVAGFASWAEPSCTYFETQLLGDLPDSTFDINDGKNVLLWINKPDPWPGDLGPVDSVIGVTLPIWTQDGMGNALIYDADIVFNGVGFCWYDHPGTPCVGGSPVDTQSIATHEQGHFLGLGHTNSAGATMEPAYVGGNDIASIEQDDIDGVCALYPVGGTTVSAAAGGVSCDPCRLSAANNECSTQTKACTGPCLGLYNCILGCPKSDSAAYDMCATQCSENFKDGLMTYMAYANCICSVCAEPCVTQCGSNGSGGGNTTSGGWGDGGGGEGGDGPKLSDGGGCGCSVIGSDEQLGALAALGIALATIARRRRAR